MTTMDYIDTIDIAASPETVFAVICNLPAMGKLSPENTGGEWLGGATGPKVGARFKGTNERDGDAWSTIAKVIAFEPPTLFSFDVTWHRFPISRWEFSVTPTAEGCRVCEGWSDRRNAVIRKDGDSETFKRVEFTKESIRTTLERLKQSCETII